MAFAFNFSLNIRPSLYEYKVVYFNPNIHDIRPNIEKIQVNNGFTHSKFNFGWNKRPWPKAMLTVLRRKDRIST